jgi:hypothetical protein
MKKSLIAALAVVSVATSGAPVLGGLQLKAGLGATMGLTGSKFKMPGIADYAADTEVECKSQKFSHKLGGAAHVIAMKKMGNMFAGLRADFGMPRHELVTGDKEVSKQDADANYVKLSRSFFFGLGVMVQGNMNPINPYAFAQWSPSKCKTELRAEGTAADTEGAKKSVDKMRWGMFRFGGGVEIPVVKAIRIFGEGVYTLDTTKKAEFKGADATALGAAGDTKVESKFSGFGMAAGVRFAV